MRKKIMRNGSTLIAIASYACGDGSLGFVSHNTNTGVAAYPPPTREEAERACPKGWHVVETNGLFRAYINERKELS